MKDLAHETAAATEQITRQIGRAQQLTNQAARSIANVAQVVEEINNVQTSLAI